MADCIIERVLQTIRESEKAALAKRKKIHELEKRIAEYESTYARLYQEIADARAALECLREEARVKRAAKNCHNLRLASAKEQDEKMYGQMRDMEESNLQLVVGLGQEVDRLWESIDKFAGNYGILAGSGPDSAREQQNREEMGNLLPELENLYEKLGIWQAVIAEREELRGKLNDAEVDVAKLRSRKLELEEEAKAMMEQIHKHDQINGDDRHEIRKLQDELLKLEQERGGVKPLWDNEEQLELQEKNQMFVRGETVKHCDESWGRATDQKQAATGGARPEGVEEGDSCYVGSRQAAAGGTRRETEDEGDSCQVATRPAATTGGASYQVAARLAAATGGASYQFATRPAAAVGRASCQVSTRSAVSAGGASYQVSARAAAVERYGPGGSVPMEVEDSREGRVSEIDKNAREPLTSGFQMLSSHKHLIPQYLQRKQEKEAGSQFKFKPISRMSVRGVTGDLQNTNATVNSSNQKYENMDQF